MSRSSFEHTVGVHVSSTLKAPLFQARECCTSPPAGSMAATKKLQASTISEDRGLHVDPGDQASETVLQPVGVALHL